MERKVIVITGPTCSGKTFLGIELARKLKSEIISADSRQIYKMLDIGTAKPAKDLLNAVKHHFVDELLPDQEFNASDFENRALEIINHLLDLRKMPVVVGGSGLYIKSLIDGIFNIVGRDEDYRAKLHELRSKFGNQFIHKELEKIDPVSAERMLPQNWKRVMRALEVYHLSGEPIWQLQMRHNREIDINFYQFGLDWDREILYENIERRVDDMINAGLVEEVKSILNLGYGREINALNTVGYKEILLYLDGGIDLQRAVSLIKRNTRRYAKRQLTWFGSDKRIEWIKINEIRDLRKSAEYIINSLR